MEDNTVNTTVDETASTQEAGTQGTTEVQEKPLTKNEILREWSKENGINLFDVEGLQQFKKFTDNQKTDLEKANEAIEAYKSKEVEWEKTKLEYESKLKASELGIATDKLEDALKLADNNPDNLAKVLEKYPSFKANSNVTVGVTEPNNTNAPTGDTEVEAYLQKNYANNPYYKKK